MVGSLEQWLDGEEWPWNVLGDGGLPSGGDTGEVRPQGCWRALEQWIWLYE